MCSWLRAQTTPVSPLFTLFPFVPPHSCMIAPSSNSFLFTPTTVSCGWRRSSNEKRRPRTSLTHKMSSTVSEPLPGGVINAEQLLTFPPNVPGGVFGHPAWITDEPFFTSPEYWMAAFVATLMTRLSFVVAAFFVSRAIAVMVFQTSKMFCVPGALHNAAEVLLLMLFIAKGRVKLWAVPFLLFYFVAITKLMLVLPWPLDILVFKFQGITADAAMTFHFLRMLVETRAKQRSYDGERHGASGYIRLEGSAALATAEKAAAARTTALVLESGGDVSADDAGSWTRVVWPTVAAFVHLAGDILPLKRTSLLRVLLGGWEAGWLMVTVCARVHGAIFSDSLLIPKSLQCFIILRSKPMKVQSGPTHPT
ncbi:hypothetical protein DFJ73DRAFT_819905 [Zopfochytrium polystomum]|nr:hypothetical protein DFJ73DRAFT_819905 [Zopfochytrium polystomum]